MPPLILFRQGYGGLAMLFKLLDAAQEHWRHVKARTWSPSFVAGATFERGALVERHEQTAKKVAA